ncbi:hypothetical protein Pmani_005100 [Petrolisthes manimaculis]|uniref:Reverse transcriptase domain-containing protein n=1 Tax=Petrolisthes manimaculis TaxID=1843537 RepID=A0AAE1UMJ7_9EUCA|nr:hypothetical protein Pmani_005100 [Petrolisthes manimaculis]
MVQVGLHQGSALSPFLFNVVFDVLTEAVREKPPWCFLYADDVILLAKSKKALQRKLEHWREALESRGLRISRSKTEYMTTDTDGDQEESIQMDGIKLKRVTSFKYLGSMFEPSEVSATSGHQSHQVRMEARRREAREKRIGFRGRIVGMHEAGQSIRTIANNLGISTKTVLRWIRR